MKAERQKKIDDQLEKKNNCCQVVLNAFCEDFGFSPESLFCRWPADLAADVPGREVRCRHGHDYGCRFGLWLPLTDRTPRKKRTEGYRKKTKRLF